MNFSFSMDILYAILGAGILIAGFIYLMRKRSKKKVEGYDKTPEKQGSDKEDDKELVASGYTRPITARIADNTNRTIYTADISGEDVKKIYETYGTLGRQWNREGKFVYGMVKLAERQYKPIAIPATANCPPEKLHYDMEQPEIPVIMDMREEKNFLDKYGKLLVWGGIMAFMIFMVMSSRGG
jgi:hypothetical protein